LFLETLVIIFDIDFFINPNLDNEKHTHLKGKSIRSK